LTVGSCFSGIGGFDLGLERTGFFEVKWQIEIDSFCQKVLSKHWPDVPKFGDIKDCGKHNLSPVDVMVGGWPCQPFSVAGKRRGKEDDRYLWPEMFRIIREIRPAWVLGENVFGFKNLALDQTLLDLDSAGYARRVFDIPACGINAGHLRHRYYIVAYSEGINGERAIAKGNRQRQSEVSLRNDGEVNANAHQSGLERRKKCKRCTSRLSVGQSSSSINGERFSESGLGGTLHGLSEGLDRFDRLWDNLWTDGWDDGVPMLTHRKEWRRERLKALGNSVIPQMIESFGYLIYYTHTGVELNGD